MLTIAVQHGGKTEVFTEEKALSHKHRARFGNDCLELGCNFFLYRYKHSVSAAWGVVRGGVNWSVCVVFCCFVYSCIFIDTCILYDGKDVKMFICHCCFGT